MKVAIRADASVTIGSGHVMRCLTLALELRRRGAEVEFVCRDHVGNLAGLILAHGFALHLLPASAGVSPDRHFRKRPPEHASWLGVGWRRDLAETRAALGDKPVDWLVVDHYALDAAWESPMRKTARRIMLIDDIGDRVHDADVLLDQNLHRNPRSRYLGLVPESCEVLLGPTYALLRREFAKARTMRPYRDGTVRRILIFFGGTDPTNETAKALDALSILGRPDISVDVVVGATNPRRAAIAAKALCLGQTTLHVQVDDISKLMVGADLSLGAGGTTTWERCALGLPSLLISVARHQKPIAEALANSGGAIFLGISESLSPESIARSIGEVTVQPGRLRALATRSMELVDGKGLDRVADRLWEAR